MAVPAFLKDFKKKIEKLETVSIGINEPGRWYSSGNYGLNRVLSGDYRRCIPESRIVLLSGASGCLPATESVLVYEFKSKPFASIDIINE